MDEVAQVREKIDIVSLISEYLPLKKAGRNFKVLCPFHSEKTPSFIVSPERQIWHCFSCNLGGDVFSFLMRYENMEFPEALRVLAKRAGVELRESAFWRGVSSEREKIYQINALSLKFYNFILTNHKAGKKALEYLIKERKLNKAIINTFHLGFAPSAPNVLSNYLIKKKNYSTKDLIFAGVSINSGGRIIDFFRGRVIFPLFDHRGNIAGFSGRALDENAVSKYINTRETPVYHKGSMFFGLNLSKEEIKKKGDCLIVEGEFDVISLFKHGIKNAVAIKGTALTEDQVGLLSRFTPKVTLCLDMDEAGFEATKRSLENLEKKGLSANIIILKDAKDPDESINKNPANFKKSLKGAVNVYDFLISRITEKEVQDAEGKKKITDTLLPIFSHITNEIVKEHFLKKLGKIIDVSLESLEREMEKIQKREKEDKIVIPKRMEKDRREILEEYLLALIIQSQDSKEILSDNKSNLLKYKFKNLAFGKIVSALFEYFEKEDTFDNKKFSNFLSAELTKAFDFCYIYPLPKFPNEEKYKEELKKVALELLAFYIKERIRLLSEKISQGDERVKKEYLGLLSELKKIQQ